VIIAEKTWVDVAGYVASLLVFATFCMRTMIPLRIAAIASNVCFIGYALAAHIYPVLILHVILLPLNTVRTVEMIRLTKRIEVAAKGDLSFDPLKPFMKTERHPVGHILFRKGDVADRMFVVSSGQLFVEEISAPLSEGDLVGEISMFSSDQVRTGTVRCRTDVELLSIARQHMAEVCFQNPSIAFYLLSLITNRLLTNMAQLDRQRPVPLTQTVQPEDSP
jgi:hypothetical protein